MVSSSIDTAKDNSAPKYLFEKYIYRITNGKNQWNVNWLKL